VAERAWLITGVNHLVLQHRADRCVVPPSASLTTGVCHSRHVRPGCGELPAPMPRRTGHTWPDSGTEAGSSLWSEVERSRSLFRVLQRQHRSAAGCGGLRTPFGRVRKSFERAAAAVAAVETSRSRVRAQLRTHDSVKLAEGAEGLRKGGFEFGRCERSPVIHCEIKSST
jgi:hypothetical protein